MSWLTDFDGDDQCRRMSWCWMTPTAVNDVNLTVASENPTWSSGNVIDAGRMGRR